MKALQTIMTLAILLSLPVTYAQETPESEDPGITPDSFLYGLDVALDKIGLLLTFGQAEKSKKGLEIARERLLEVKAMAEENKTNAMIKAQNEHDRMLDKVKESIKEIKNDNTTEEIDEEIEVETELEKHVIKIDEVRGDLKVRLKIKGNMTHKQRSVIDSILSAMENKTGEVRIEINNRKGKTKMRMKIETGKDIEEIEDEIDEHEARKGLTGMKKERAYDRIEDAREEIEEAKDFLGNATSELLTLAEHHLENAKDAYDSGDYGKAYGQATAAENIAESIKEEVEEKEIEKHGHEKQHKEDSEAEFEIDAKIMGNETLVKVKANGEKTTFTLETTSRAEVVLEVAARLGINSDLVERIIEFEDEEDDSFEQGFEVGNKSMKKVEKKGHKKTDETEETETGDEKEVEEDEDGSDANGADEGKHFGDMRRD